MIIGRKKNPKAPLDRREMLKRRRERWAIFILSIVFVLLTVAEIQLTKTSHTLPFVNSIFFFGLVNINIIILIALVWLIFRNIGKIFFERRSRLLGARLKTKLVLAFLAFSITPTLILFFISSLYINSSFDKWFSLKIQNTLKSSLDITRTYYRNADNTGMHFAQHLSQQLSERFNSSQMPDQFESQAAGVRDYLSKQRSLLALNALEYYSDPFEERVLAAVSLESHADLNPKLQYPRLSLDLLNRAFAGEKVSIIHNMGTGDLIRSIVPMGTAENNFGVLVVNTYIPISLVNKVDEIATVFDDYKDTNPLMYPIKTQYFVILIMLTLVIIAVAIWIGLYLARELTVPVERLVRGAKAVGAGNLDVSIESTGDDEISVLIDSFNAMTSDLRQNRSQLTQATEDLKKRRLQLEAVLANIGTGVIVVDRRERISTFNRAATQLLGAEPIQVLGKKYQEVLSKKAGPLLGAIRRAFAEESKDAEVAQWTYRFEEELKTLAGIVTPLYQEKSRWGVVVVIDDISHLVKSQREMAWREVARRIAHEIKNPLTPIKLSAQRLQRKMGFYSGREGDLLKECTDTIVQNTDALKEMVNEFSDFARFPEASPAPHNLDEAICEVITLFTQAHPEIRFENTKGGNIPIFEFDRDQIKRVVINLFDNAVAALKSYDSRTTPKIQVSTHYNEKLQLVVITVQDNGPGISEEVKSRLFEPYFSTKNEGTGLGLAIAKRIVSDHDGFIRVQSTPGKGTQFLIELPTQVKPEVQRFGTKEENHVEIDINN